MSRLRGACGAAQGVGGGQVVRGKLGRLLITPLRLAGHAAGEAQLGQTDRQPVRLRAVSSISRRPGQRTPQLVGDLIERGPPGTGELAGRELESSALIQAPTQVARECLDRLACVLEPLDAVLADGFQGAVASPARPRDRDQQALVGEPGQDGRDSAGRHRRPTGQNHRRRGSGERAGENRDPAQHRLIGFVQQCVTPVERRAQRTMPVVDPRAAGQQPQPVGQPSFEPVEPERREPGGGQLDRQRHAIEAPADGGDAFLVVGRQRTPAGCCPPEEQLDRVTRATVVRFDGQPGHREHPFEGNQQPGPAGGEHAQPWTAGE